MNLWLLNYPISIECELIKFKYFLTFMFVGNKVINNFIITKERTNEYFFQINQKHSLAKLV